jgi:hypothetical protein
MDELTAFPLPGTTYAVVAVPAPGNGRGYWAGSPSCALDDDGTFVLAYRVRTGEDGRGSTVVARSQDGEHFTTVASLDQARFGAQSMERPALVRRTTAAGACTSARPRLRRASTGGSLYSRRTTRPISQPPIRAPSFPETKSQG